MYFFRCWICGCIIHRKDIRSRLDCEIGAEKCGCAHFLTAWKDKPHLIQPCNMSQLSSMNRFRYLLMQISELKRKPDWKKWDFLAADKEKNLVKRRKARGVCPFFHQLHSPVKLIWLILFQILFHSKSSCPALVLHWTQKSYPAPLWELLNGNLPVVRGSSEHTFKLPDFLRLDFD